MDGLKAPLLPVKLAHPSMAKNVVLVTTRWEDLRRNSDGVKRETDLLTKYWRTMLEKGSTSARFTKTHDSAWQIADHIQHGKIDESSICLELANILRQLPEKPRTSEPGFFTFLFWRRHK
ncbi:hypothetical protein DFH29DRAFT_307812 [Suillus ampliporus]|nr:hypothetical protein DFH29DRAFT_307812 [Suillus ampliporus]